MKRILATALALTAISASMAQNQPGQPQQYASPASQTYSDVAQVISAQPIVERNSTPRQECSNETVTTDRRVPSQGYVNAGYAAAQPQPAPAPQATGERSIGAGTVIGAIIGGVVGHQFGNSSGGRDRGTAAGVVLGGIIGNQIDNSPSAAPTGYAPAPVAGPARVDYVPETRTVQNCRTVYDARDEITGYNVVYRYQGRDYTTRMAYDPGTTMRVSVNLAPEVRR
ncbi:MAG: glycine zipper 2TM domain-containing protein [Casimicrobium sp.]